MFDRFFGRATVAQMDSVASTYRDISKERARILQAIIDMETPGANATVKRMAAKAREGLAAGGEGR